jgi:hypothetical protein
MGKVLVVSGQMKKKLSRIFIFLFIIIIYFIIIFIIFISNLKNMIWAKKFRLSRAIRNLCHTYTL